MIPEIWKPIIIDGIQTKYLVSNHGKIWSLITNKYRKLLITDGYYHVNLKYNKSESRQRIHRLVAAAFIENPNCLPIVNHKDGNKLNNYILNLEWVSVKENNNHARNILGVKSLTRTVDQYSDDGITLIASFPSMKEAKYATGSSHVGDACTGRNKTSGGYVWKYSDKREKSEVPIGKIHADFPNYIITENGNVYSIIFKRYLLSNIANGYQRIELSNKGKKKKFYIHVLVARLYIINPEPDIRKYVNHIDGNKQNNCVTNLEWVTQKENIIHAYESGGSKKYKKGVIKYDLLGNELGRFTSITEASTVTHVSASCISGACNGRYKTAGGFVWKYID